MRRSNSSSLRRRNETSEEIRRDTELDRIRVGKALRIGAQSGNWIGRLDSKSKLRIVWRLIFGSSRGRAHEVACTVSHKSKKRQVFFDAELIHSGALGLLESVGGVAADTTLFEHTWEVSGRKFILSERVFLREGQEVKQAVDESSASALRDAARFDLSIDGILFHLLPDIERIPPSELHAMEQRLQDDLLSTGSSARTSRTMSPQKQKMPPSPPRGPGQPSGQQQGNHLQTTTPHKSEARPKTKPTPKREVMTSTKKIKAKNGLAARIDCTLGPGVLGGKITLKNDDSGQLVEIATASHEARACGVYQGDILLSLNGRALPPKLDALELMALLKANPRYMLSEVTACLWRPLLRDGGKYLSLRLKSVHALEFMRIDAFESVNASSKTHAFLLGHFALASIGNAVPIEKDLNLKRGDVLVGIDGSPVEKYATTSSTAQKIGDWVADARFDLILWRPTTQSIVDAIQTASTKKKRTIFLATPSEVASIASKSHSGIWGTATTAVTVTGDGGHGEISPEERLSSSPQKNSHTNFKKRPTSSRQLLSENDSFASLSSSSSESESASLSSPPPSTSTTTNTNTNTTRRRHHAKAKQKEEKTTPLLNNDDKNFAVFKRLLQSGATLDEIVNDMRAAGIPKEVTTSIIGKARNFVAVKRNEAPEMNSKKNNDDDETAAADPRKAMLAMIAKRQGVKSSSSPAEEDTASEKTKEAARNEVMSIHKKVDPHQFDAVLARYRKMVKIGVPAASVHQRMRLDQIDHDAINAFATEHGLEIESKTNDQTTGHNTSHKKGAKLHWDAMKLDDKALAVSVWAADAFGHGNDQEDPIQPQHDLLGDDDLERLTHLFLDAEKKNMKKKDATSFSSSSSSENKNIQINGRPLINTRLFDPQRSQNVSITLTPLIRQYDGSAEAVACLIARMESDLAVEQLETLRAAMPTLEEKTMVLDHVKHACESLEARDLIDSAIEKDPRFSVSSRAQGLGALSSSSQDSPVKQKSNISVVDLILRESVISPTSIKDEAYVLAASAEGKAMIRKAFIIENLAPAERFAYAVSDIEKQLNTLRAQYTLRGALLAPSSATTAPSANLSDRLEALVIALSARPATELLAEKADAYTKAARLLMTSKDLARLLKHVLAAGNAVNAGSAKADASAVRLSSLLQAARTKGADGKTTLLDGVVGLLLDRATKHSTRDSPQNTTNEVLDFPEHDGLLASLDAVRGADERALSLETTKIKAQVNLLSKEIKSALLEFGSTQATTSSSSKHQAEKKIPPVRIPACLTIHLLPHGSSHSRRAIEHDRLTQLETEAGLRCDALRKDHILPLETIVKELRSYFACEPTEPLDDIFRTMRDFLRAFCDSRDIQRRQRRAEQREADRKKAAVVQRTSITHSEPRAKHNTNHHHSVTKKTTRPISSSHQRARPPSHPPPPKTSLKKHHHPSPRNSVKSRRSALVGEDNDDFDDGSRSPLTSDEDV